MQGMRPGLEPSGQGKAGSPMTLFQFVLQFLFLLITTGAGVFLGLIGLFWIYDMWTDR